MTAIKTTLDAPIGHQLRITPTVEVPRSDADSAIRYIGENMGGGGPGGSAAPDDAEYIVASGDGDLSNERVLTDTATIAWDFSTLGQAKANLTGTLANIVALGDPGADRGLFWDDSASAFAYFQTGTALGFVGTQLSVTDTELVALAGVTAAADKLPYFDSVNSAALADFPAFGRTLVANSSALLARADLELNTLTGIDDVNTTGIAVHDVLYWTGAEWRPSPTSALASLSELSDVSVSGIADGYVLIYDAATSTWTAEPYAGTGSITGAPINAGYYVTVASGTLTNETVIPAYIQTLLDDTTASAARDTLELGTGDNVEFTNLTLSADLAVGGNAVITGTLDVTSVTVDDEAYDATGWNADLTVPTKNAVRDQIEAEPSATRTLTNKTLNLTSNTLTGTIAQFNTSLSDGDFATLAGSETLTNKTIALGSNTISGTLAQFNTAVTDANLVPEARQVISGAGLAGGGDLSADRTLAVGAGTGITVNADDVALDTSSNRNVDHSGVTLTAGAGLTGGGDITASRSFAVGAGTGITVNADDVALDTASTRNTDHSGVTLTAGAGLTGGGDISASRSFAVGAGTGITVNADDVAMSTNARTITLTAIIDGGGEVLTTGVKGYLEIPFACTITAVRMLADVSGSAVVDIWKDTYANYPPTDADSITASATPTITTATKSENTTLTGWTTSISAGDILGFNVDSATTITKLTVALTVVKTS